MEVKCYQCGKPAIDKYGDKPLCVDCLFKITQSNFMEQQAMHNKLSWLATQQNYIQEALYARTGGLLPLKQVQIPLPPSAGINNTVNNINISDSAVGVVNPGIIDTIRADIDVINYRGEPELASAIKDLTQEVVNSTDIGS